MTSTPVQEERKFLQNPHIQGFLVLTVIGSLSLFFILGNRRPTAPVAAPVAAPNSSEIAATEWQELSNNEMTPLPSPTPVIPTIPPSTFQATFAVISAQPTIPPATSAPLPEPPTPDFVRATPLPAPTNIVAAAQLEPTQNYQLPPEQVPLSAHPNDHFWFTRPIDVSANSQYLLFYSYGAGEDLGWKIHRGLDLPNRTGQHIRAAASGQVIWAGEQGDRGGSIEDTGELEIYKAYGNFVVIEHDFGWRGQPIWTLYAHMASVTVRPGQVIEVGDVVGLVGSTGLSTGPHVHFEIRVGTNSYFSTRNPILWMAPYIGHGIVAGRIIDAEGHFVDNARVQLAQEGRITNTTRSYTRPYARDRRSWTVVPDDYWQENFALGDIPVGEYQVVVTIEERRYTEIVEVKAATTSFVEIRVDFRGTVPDENIPSNPAPGVPTIPPTALPTTTPIP